MKKLLLFIICSCISSLIWAKDYLLVVEFTDGTDMSFALSKQPVLSFADKRVSVSMEGRNSLIEISDIENFHFEEKSSDILSPHADDDYTIIWQGEDLVVISNVKIGLSVHLYSVDGTIYPNHVNDNGNHIKILLSTLPKGIYLININNNKNLKISRK